MTDARGAGGETRAAPNRPGRVAPPRRSPLAETLLNAMAQGGLTPPSPAALSRRLGAKPQIVTGVVGDLVRRGDILELRDGLLIARSSVEALAGELQAGGPMTFSIAEFKARFGLSRKWAIPLLERLDADGVTRRRGDLREVLAAEPAGAEDRPASG